MQKWIRLAVAALAIAGMITTATMAAQAATQDDKNEYSSVLTEMTDGELDELCRVLFLECRGEPFEGKVACVEVIFNRVLSDSWPDTVHDVLSQKGQFVTYKRIDRAYDVREDDIAVSQGEINRAIMYAYKNGRTVLPNGNYVYFDTRGVNGRNHIQIGNHYFGEGK